MKVLLVVVVIAVVTYLAVRHFQDRGLGPGRAQPPRRPKPPRPSRPTAPDDDEDFLRDLDRKRRQDPPPG